MAMSYMQFMKNTDNDQKRQIEIENIQSALLNELFNLGYEPGENIEKKLNDIAEQLVNEKSKTMGFRNMSLAQLSEAYERNF